MVSSTKIINNERQWTKGAIAKILKFKYGLKSVNWTPKEVLIFLDAGLQEANFTSKNPVYDPTLGRMKYCWILKSNGWRFHVWVWIYKDMVELKKDTVELKIGSDQHNDLGDLIYLWDKVRSSWELKKSTP
jgi:hypothetical protein